MRAPWRTLLAIASAVAPLVARADTFGGFSGVDRPYLVNQDRACRPLTVAGGAATGVPTCAKTGADVLAHLDIKPPTLQTGAAAVFSASAAGRTLTVRRASGDVVVAWEAPDPIGKVLEVFASHDEDRVAVTYSVRRAGRDMTDVVAFDLLTGGATPAKPPVTTPTGPGDDAPAPPADPAVAKAESAARAAGTAKAWQAVLALDADHSEARFRLAVIAARGKKLGEAMALITALAAHKRADAVEFLVEARFDAAFAPLRADPAFRAAVGLDRKPATAYERFMGLGGQWEQTGTACDQAEVRLTALRDRSFKLHIKTACEGRVMDLPFHGTWRVADGHVVLRLPTPGRAAGAADDAPCTFEASGDEDALHCVVGKDLEFIVLPTRR